MQSQREALGPSTPGIWGGWGGPAAKRAARPRETAPRAREGAMGDKGACHTVLVKKANRSARVWRDRALLGFS